jgi:hypothetical protein
MVPFDQSEAALVSVFRSAFGVGAGADGHIQDMFTRWISGISLTN